MPASHRSLVPMVSGWYLDINQVFCSTLNLSGVARRIRPGHAARTILCVTSRPAAAEHLRDLARLRRVRDRIEDRKSTRLNSSHSQISYAVFCLKKKKITLLCHDSYSRQRISQ